MRPLRGGPGRFHRVDQNAQRGSQHDPARQHQAEIPAEEAGAVVVHDRTHDRQARKRAHERSARGAAPQNEPAGQKADKRDRRDRLAVRAHEIRQSKKCRQHRIELGVEVAKDVPELGQDEVEEEQQDRARGEQKESGIAQRVADPPPQRFGALALRRQRLEDGHQRAGGFADPDERDVDRRENLGMFGDRLAETFARKNRACERRRGRPHAAHLGVAGEQLERVVDAGARVQQQSQVAGENRDVLRAAGASAGATPGRCVPNLASFRAVAASIGMSPRYSTRRLTSARLVASSEPVTISPTCVRARY